MGKSMETAGLPNANPHQRKRRGDRPQEKLTPIENPDEWFIFRSNMFAENSSTPGYDTAPVTVARIRCAAVGDSVGANHNLGDRGKKHPENLELIELEIIFPGLKK